MRRLLLVPFIAILAACGESGRMVHKVLLDGQAPPEPAAVDPATKPIEMPPANSAMLDSPAWLRQNSPVEWTVPPGWEQELSTRPQRLVEFTIEKNGPGNAPLQFLLLRGVDQGSGANQQNVDRWTAFFEQDTAPKMTTSERDGLRFTRWRVHGKFQGQIALGTGDPINEPNWTMLCGWVEAPAGSVLFKLVGPDATVAANESKVEALLASMKARQQKQ
jgi:hypothetical protein